MNPKQLYVIATPIGNLDDMSRRAVSTLETCEIFLCEDTRVTQRLLGYLGIKGKTLLRLNENSDKSIEDSLRAISGRIAALVTDSGTPGLSDPGAKLISRLNIPATPIPGPSSIAAAVSISGLGRRGFVFLGFPPRSKGKLKREIRESLKMKKAIVFLESPFRIKATLEIINEIAPKAHCVACRELTKMHEEVLTGTPQALIETLSQRTKILGEFTVVLEDR